MTFVIKQPLRMQRRCFFLKLDRLGSSFRSGSKFSQEGHPCPDPDTPESSYEGVQCLPWRKVLLPIYYIPVEVHCGLRKVPISSFHGIDAQASGQQWWVWEHDVIFFILKNVYLPLALSTVPFFDSPEEKNYIYRIASAFITIFSHMISMTYCE